MLVAGPIKSTVLIEKVSQLGLLLGQGAEVAGAGVGYEQGSGPGVRSTADGQSPPSTTGVSTVPVTLPHPGPVVSGLPYHPPSLSPPSGAHGLPPPPELLQLSRTSLCLPPEKHLALGIPSAIPPESPSHWVAQAEFKTLMARGEASTVSQRRLALSRLHLPREL